MLTTNDNLDTYQTYKVVFEASPDAIIIIDDRGQITLVNKQAVKMFGLAEEEMLGKEIELLIPARFHKIHREERKDYATHPVARGMGPELNIVGKRKDGTEFPVEISLSPINLKGSTYIAAAIRDVTARKEMEEKLLGTEKKYQTALDNMLEGVIILDFNFRFVYFNNAYLKISKCKKEELTGHSIMERFPGIETTEVFKTYQQCMTERISKHLETEFVFPDNSTGWFEISIQPVPEGLFVLVIEITERKQAEEKIKASERMLAESQEVMHIGSWEWDIADDKITWSDEMYRIHGISSTDFDCSYEDYFKYIHPNDRDSLKNAVEQSLRDHTPFEFYYQVVRPDGNTRSLHLHADIIFNKSQQPVKMLGVAADITERKQAEEEIARQKKFTEEILNNLPADIAVLDSHQNYIFINKHAIDDSKIREWLIGKNDFDYCRLKGMDDTFARDGAALFNKAIQTKSETEWIDERKSEQGQTLYVFRKFQPVFENDRLKHVILYGIDVTDLKTAEIKLREAIISAQKAYKELEQFSYMVSHDLQEPLRMVTGFLDLLKSETEELLDDSAKEYIFYAIHGAERMKTLIHDLLQYSRVGTNNEDFSNINLNELLKDIKHVLLQNNEITEAHITVKPLPAVKGSKTLLYQLFINLVSNALKYHKKNVDPEVEIGYTEQRNTYTFYVKDNGIGIEPTSFEKIFIIFHRLHSRTEYSGTGIGLAICKKIVQTHGGSIWVESKPGSGSTFYFTISKNQI